MKPRDVIVLDEVAVVLLSGGHFAVIDASDVGIAKGFNWSANASKRTIYAHRIDLTGERPAKVILHREILGAPIGVEVDHINGNGLDCRRVNLRLATSQQNALNRRLRIDNQCGFKGVSPLGRKFSANIQSGGVRRYLGLFETPEEAHAAYCAASVIYHGEFRRAM